MKLAATSMARGACPALDAPMLTGDGYLSRVALIDAIAPSQLAALCSLSVKHGNGVLDISARGNLQIRGLTLKSAVELETEVRALDLPLREGLAVEWSPLAGFEEAVDARPLAFAIMEGAKDFGGKLAPKLSVVLETNGLIRLEDLLADIRLVTADDGGWNIYLGGIAATGRALGYVRQHDATHCVAALLSHFAGLGPKTRGRDIDPGALPQSIGRYLEARNIKSDHSHQNPFGVFALVHAAYALRVALPFGQIKAAALHAFAEQAASLSIESVRPASDHSLLAFGQYDACEKLKTAGQQLGFIVRADDPLRQIHACSGMPSCNSAHLATHEIGQFAANQTAPLFDNSLRLHISGCPKGCAHPTPSPLALVGTETGSHLVFCGKTTDTPIKQLAPGREKAALTALAHLVETQRRNGETNHDCLVRLGPGGIAAALGEGP